MDPSAGTPTKPSSPHVGRRVFIGLLIAVPALMLAFAAVVILDVLYVSESETCDPAENSELFEMTDEELDALCGVNRGFEIHRD